MTTDLKRVLAALAAMLSTIAAIIFVLWDVTPGDWSQHIRLGVIIIVFGAGALAASFPFED
jgi:hypothetical protein